jgi:hypothetical protein
MNDDPTYFGLRGMGYSPRQAFVLMLKWSSCTDKNKRIGRVARHILHQDGAVNAARFMEQASVSCHPNLTPHEVTLINEGIERGLHRYLIFKDEENEARK